MLIKNEHAIREHDTNIYQKTIIILDRLVRKIDPRKERFDFLWHIVATKGSGGE